MHALAQSTVRVTWLEVGERAVYLIARCEDCGVVVEREIAEMDEGWLEMIGHELLCADGCVHTDAAVGSGTRPALRTR